jgi:spore maturation protein CgeB
MRIAKSFAKLLGKKVQLSRIFSNLIYRKRLQRFLEVVDSCSPDVVFVMRLNHFDVATMKNLRLRCKTVCWMLEPKDIDVVRQDIEGYDLYYSMHKSHESVGAIYLPVFAYDPVHFGPKICEKDIPLLFVGSWSPRRQEWLESVVELSKFLTIIGGNWKKKLGKHHPLFGSVKADWIGVEELKKWYQRAQVVINVNRIEVEDAAGGNLRLADVPACGTVLLTEYSDDLTDYFDVQTEIATFRRKDELIRLCRELLSNADFRLRIKTAGSLAMQRIGTYDDRMRVVLDDLNRLGAQ